MKKFILVVSMFLCLFKAEGVSAESYVVSESANLVSNQTQDNFDLRVVTLRNYLSSHNSPLTQSADTFVYLADVYDLDWRLVAAISGVESTFGKRIPYNSYNAYGWANGEYAFESWDQSIETVSKALREKYLDKGATNIYSIARRYAPPSSTWAGNVLFFMGKIDPLGLEYTLEG